MQTSGFFFRLSAISLLLLVLTGFCSCVFFNGSEKVVIWTDRPEFALYAEYFNTSQSKYKVEIQYYESPAQKLTETAEYPDIAIASWLKSVSTRTLFRPLDNLLSNEDLNPSSFYPRLLSLGSSDNRQYLLPVNFNLPAMIFARNFNRSYSLPFTIEMEEIKEQGKAFNTETRGVYTRMGFSPSSSNEFLFLVTTLFGTSFREASPIAWDNQALERSVTWIKDWITEANTSIQTEDDFAYKYFYDPPEKLVNSGRILYTYMNSSGFFTLPEESRTNLDFRWLAARDMIPLDEWSTYYGIHRKTKVYKAAKAFTVWFFNEETQRLLLEASKSKRLNETSFGIAGGFSAMRTVTEQVFPKFYPDLLGRMPPEAFISPSNVLPRNWIAVKERVILPYIWERIRLASREEVRPLERRISDWYRLNIE